jgi:hypothetical protein
MQPPSEHDLRQCTPSKAVEEEEEEEKRKNKNATEE